jgi:hypothetical protein
MASEDMETDPIRINVYYRAGCPNRHFAVQRINEVLKESGVAGTVTQIQVNPEWELALGFLGSPTVHVNGVDVEPSARTQQGPSVSCRTYREGELVDGAPSKEMICQALLEAGKSGNVNSASG